MPKCKTALQHGCSSVNLLHIFRTSFYKNTYRGLLLYTENISWAVKYSGVFVKGFFI